jgi:uncharacterized protein (TIGR03435 family)
MNSLYNVLVRKAAVLGWTLVLSSVWAQSVPARRSFEVVSIRPTEGQGDATFFSGIKISGATVVMRNIAVGTLIRAAFGVKARFLSGPDWLEGKPRFDIRATMPAGATAQQVPEMLQSLLAERYELAVHIERQERQVYALLVGKGGVKFQKSSDIDESMPGGAFTGINAISDERGSRVWTSPDRSAMRITPLPDGGARWDLTGISLPELAYVLDTQDGLDVVDMTQIKGNYDFMFTAAAEDLNDLSRNPAPASTTPGTRESLQRLGLRLQKRKAAVEVLVIDHLEKTPTGN